MPDTSIQQDKELEELIQKELIHFHMENARNNTLKLGSRADQGEYHLGVVGLNDSTAQILMALRARDKELERKARLQAASDILNLANEYACDDSTMRGSEEIRNYHYFNAIHKIGELSS